MGGNLTFNIILVLHLEKATMHEKNRTVTREELYDLVWSKPMSLLAKEFEISDVGLAKICKRMEIPRPPRGDWQKLKVGETPPALSSSISCGSIPAYAGNTSNK